MLTKMICVAMRHHAFSRKLTFDLPQQRTKFCRSARE